MYRIITQRATKKFYSPDTKSLRRWAKQTLSHHLKSAELTIRIVTEKEMLKLNSTYRKKNYPTNVLSFPFDMPAELRDECLLLGDVVICASVIKKEAEEQHKNLEAHWAHMVVHGCLHLLGHDHVKESDADKMENLEITILNELGFSNPYLQLEGKTT